MRRGHRRAEIVEPLGAAADQRREDRAARRRDVGLQHAVAVARSAGAERRETGRQRGSRREEMAMPSRRTSLEPSDVAFVRRALDAQERDGHGVRRRRRRDSGRSALRTAAAIGHVVDHDDRHGACLLPENGLGDAGADAAVYHGDLANNAAIGLEGRDVATKAHRVGRRRAIPHDLHDAVERAGVSGSIGVDCHNDSPPDRRPRPEAPCSLTGTVAMVSVAATEMERLLDAGVAVT